MQRKVRRLGGTVRLRSAAMAAPGCSGEEVGVVGELERRRRRPWRQPRQAVGAPGPGGATHSPKPTLVGPEAAVSITASDDSCKSHTVGKLDRPSPATASSGGGEGERRRRECGDKEKSKRGGRKDNLGKRETETESEVVGGKGEKVGKGEGEGRDGEGEGEREGRLQQGEAEIGLQTKTAVGERGEEVAEIDGSVLEGVRG